VSKTGFSLGLKKALLPGQIVLIFDWKTVKNEFMDMIEF
jgi:hypothetical protein